MKRIFLLTIIFGLFSCDGNIINKSSQNKAELAFFWEDLSEVDLNTDFLISKDETVQLKIVAKTKNGSKDYVSSSLSSETIVSLSIENSEIITITPLSSGRTTLEVISDSDLKVFLDLVVFKETLINLGEENKLSASGQTGGDYFGSTVALFNNYLAVGAEYNQERQEGAVNQGVVYLYEKNDSFWDEKGKIAPEEHSNEHFGCSVAMSENYLIVGAKSESDELKTATGAAYVYKLENSTWVQEAHLTASDGRGSDYFGESVAISSEYALVGAASRSETKPGSGAIYFYKNDNDTWQETQKICPEDLGEDKGFGSFTLLSKSYAVITSYPYHGRQNSIYIYKRDYSVWIEQQKLDGLLSYGEQDFSPFRATVSMDKEEKYLIIGDPYCRKKIDGDLSENVGTVYLYKNNGYSWELEVELLRKDPKEEERFGHAVAIHGDFALISAPGENQFSGSVYLFKKYKTGWVQELKFKLASGKTFDWFGRAVSLYNSNLIMTGYCPSYEGGEEIGFAYFYNLE